MRVEDGRPVVNGVFVNGRGPYRFLVDTGSNVNLIETDLAWEGRHDRDLSGRPCLLYWQDPGVR
jgi:hypothetical protein